MTPPTLHARIANAGLTAAQVVATLDTTQKITLVSGRDFWTTEAIESAGLPPVMLTDGPHGLRKQAGDSDHIGLANSVPATCFPTAATLGSTWDPALLEEVGAALGRESRAENVGVLLGPGLNIKRHPAGGRTFEYLSEDPFLSGKMAAGLVRGIQSEGVGACLKHYAANNQESNRMIVDTLIDERTLREIYLTGFEIAVKESAPWTVMCSYNKINGEHAGESRRLLTDILRSEWGFDGLVMTDWFATYDRPRAIAAGLDLEMPGTAGTWDASVAAALTSGELSMADLDRAATRVVDMMIRATTHDGASDSAPITVDFDAHHALAIKAAAAGSVLLTNNGLLPLAAKGTIAVIGAFADQPRFQGNGSSLVNPTQLTTFRHSMREALGEKAALLYAPGYDAATGDTTDQLIAEAVETASHADAVVLVAGLPGRMESEGYDRDHLDLPAGHNALIEAITAANPNTAVILVNGAPVEMPWADKPAAILEAYLGGQAGGRALADIVLGMAEPGGRLAESFPFHASDIASDKNFPGAPTQVEYREGLYVGYRFHDTADVAPRFAFGHGLSYTTFAYSDLTVKASGEGGHYSVSVTVTNTGKRSGTEVVQLYVHDVESTMHRPIKELKGFAKVSLKPGASQTVTLELDRRAFAIYCPKASDWVIESGEFAIQVGSSSANIQVSQTITVDSADAVSTSAAPLRLIADDVEFASMLGRTIPEPLPLLPFHRDSTVAHLQQTVLGRRLYALILRAISKRMGAQAEAPAPSDAPAPIDDSPEVMQAMLMAMPLRGVAMASDGNISLTRLDRIIGVLNAVSIKALKARMARPAA
ncbi:MAG: glycosyl hydrolase [Actinobacteria bacterium HGW-Actinobacteria-4]|nr:MAG: glycosyl hydrolase [Actinobacteria bacterium HGW-Actinobacteria-4]